jgi:hypothetical protein
MATLIFMPGHWNTPACYDALIACLTSYSYSSATIINPYHGCDATTFDFFHDSKCFKSTMTELARIRRDVILVLHPSHSRSSVKRQEKAHVERSLKTGVARCVFFMVHFKSEGFESTDGEAADLADFELEVSDLETEQRLLVPRITNKT